MIYGYIRVSTEEQNLDNQKKAISERFQVDSWIEEKRSGTIDYKKRNLGVLMEKLQSGDVLVITELSRLGRSLTMIFNIINLLKEKNVRCVAIKNNFDMNPEVLTPLKWAYNNELLSVDLSRGWVMYKCSYKKRAILTMEMARNLFRVSWDNDMARLASMLSMCTGMRSGEILALTADDLGDNCIYVRHSYNMKDGLKSTKNGEERTVYVYFPFIMAELKKLALLNPHNCGAGFLFFGRLPDKPIDCNVLRKYFRRALVSAGMNQEDAQKMTFHAWRHFYTTYMSDKVNQRALQSQTGHKTQIMLEHYAAHQTAEEAQLITKAQAEVFGSIFD